ncbi:MAG: hypothetical protein H7Z75_16090, partial [Ferruginibacter sp.]|nr:hypothetical protein [Cytophagales bacterium]
LHYLRRREIDALLFRVESLRKYAGTHLKDSSSIRSKTFFKLLELTVRLDLNPGQCRLKSKYLLTRLQNAPLPGDAYAEIEIIPYEHLWDLTLKLLKEKSSRVF